MPPRRLDALGLGDVAFARIDVEGHELAVLRKGLGTLRRWQPVLLLEADDRHRPDILAACGALLAELRPRMERAGAAGA